VREDIKREIRRGDVSLRAFILGLAVLAAAAASPATHAQAPDRMKIVAAKEMMEVTGAAKQFDQMVPLMFDQLAKAFGQMAPGKDREIREAFDKITPRFMERKYELIDQIAALYAAEMTLEDIQAVIAFFKSPVGVRFAEAQPKITRDSMVLGQRWGEKLGMELQEEARRELRRRGFNM
jgi:hypothetical protein